MAAMLGENGWWAKIRSVLAKEMVLFKDGHRPEGASTTDEIGFQTRKKQKHTPYKGRALSAKAVDRAKS